MNNYGNLSPRRIQKTATGSSGGEFCETSLEYIDMEEERFIMKRILAFLIDYIVLIIITTTIGLMIFNVMERYGIDIFEVIPYYTIPMFGIMWFYFFWTDYFFKGRTLGKKLVGIQIVCGSGQITLQWAIAHSILKIFAGCFWPISAIYFLCNEIMFYDNWLNLKVKEEKA